MFFTAISKYIFTFLSLFCTLNVVLQLITSAVTDRERWFRLSLSWFETVDNIVCPLNSYKVQLLEWFFRRAIRYVISRHMLVNHRKTERTTPCRCRRWMDTPETPSKDSVSWLSKTTTMELEFVRTCFTTYGKRIRIFRSHTKALLRTACNYCSLSICFITSHKKNERYAKLLGRAFDSGASKLNAWWLHAWLQGLGINLGHSYWVNLIYNCQSLSRVIQTLLNRYSGR